MKHTVIAGHSLPPWLALGGSPIKLIEWTDVADITSVRLIHTEHDQFFCRAQQKNGTLLLETGEDDSIQDDYWLAPGHAMPSIYGDRAQAVELPLTESLKTLIESAVFVDEVLYCQVCSDHTYEERYGISKCGHLRYIEHLSSWGGCGYTEDDLSEDYAEAFKRLAKQLKAEPASPDDTIEILVQYLSSRELQEIWRLTDRYSHSELEPATKYLNSLTDTTPQDYFEQAVVWLRPRN